MTEEKDEFGLTAEHYNLLTRPELGAAIYLSCARIALRTLELIPHENGYDYTVKTHPDNYLKNAVMISPTPEDGWMAFGKLGTQDNLTCGHDTPEAAARAFYSELADGNSLVMFSAAERLGCTTE